MESPTQQIAGSVPHQLSSPSQNPDQELVDEFREKVRIHRGQLLSEEIPIVNAFLLAGVESLKTFKQNLQGKPRTEDYAYDNLYSSQELRDNAADSLLGFCCKLEEKLRAELGERYQLPFKLAPPQIQLGMFARPRKPQVGGGLLLDISLSVAMYFALKHSLGSSSAAGVATAIGVAGLFVLGAIFYFAFKQATNFPKTELDAAHTRVVKFADANGLL